MKYSSFIFLAYLFLVSCTGNKKQIAEKSTKEIIVETEEIVIDSSSVLNLKSYYLTSIFQNDSLCIIYGYNYKSHALDCIDLRHKQVNEILLEDQGESAITHSICGLYVHTPDSLWVYDDTQRILLLDKTGKIVQTVHLRKEIKEGEQILIQTNHATSTSRLFYDKEHKSVLYGLKDVSASPVAFKVRETFLDGITPSVDYPLQPSVSVTDVSGGDYANMSDVNINYSTGKIIYNYPVESHVYVMDRQSKKTIVVEADSRYTRNVSEKCKSKDYSQWERHGIENPHFFDVMCLPEIDKYVRLHLGEKEFDATKELQDLGNDRILYLTLFDSDFNMLGETQLTSRRYNYFTGWGGMSDALCLFVNNSLNINEQTEGIVLDIVRIP